MTIDQECVQEHASLILPRIQYLAKDYMAVLNGVLVCADSVMYPSTICAHGVVHASTLCLNRCSHHCISAAGASLHVDLRGLSSA